MAFRILHLSDVHLSEGIVRAVSRRVEVLVALCLDRLMPINMVVFTGDAAYSGKRAEFGLFKTHFVEPLIQHLNLDLRDLIIVPGNHDVDRVLINQTVQMGLTAMARTADGADEAWWNSETRNLALARLKEFYDFAEATALRHASFLLDLGDRSVGFACLNSAWNSAGDTDRHNLVIAKAQFDEEFKRVAPADIRVGAWHHPLHWLADHDSQAIRDRLLEHFDLCLMGHYHEEDVTFLGSPQGQTFISVAPAFFVPGRSQGFLVYDIQLATRELEVRSFRWSDKRNQYFVDLEFAPNGVWSGRLPDRSKLDSRSALVLSTLRKTVLQEYRRSLLLHLPSISPSGQQLGIEERFIDPHLVEEEENGKLVPSSELVSSAQNFVIEGSQQSGKSTLLQFIGMRLIEGGELAASVHFQDLARYESKSGLIALLSNVLRISKREAARVIAGGIALLVDEAILDYDRPQWRVLSGWLAESSHLRIVAAGRPPGLPGATGSPPEGWRVLSINPLPINRLRSVISTLGVRVGLAEADLELDEIIQTTITAELPRWPWVILLLFELARRARLGGLANLSGLIRGYIDLRLGELQLPLGSDRARIYERMLRLVATSMIQRRTDRLPYAEAVRSIQNEAEQTGIDLSAEGLLSEFISTGLLVEEEGHVLFAFFILQEFLHAEHLRETLWRSPGDLDEDGLIRNAGSLTLLAEMVDIPELVDHAFALAKRTAPAEPPLTEEELAGLQEILAPGSPDDVVASAREAVPELDKVEELVSQIERESRGARLRRVKLGKEGMQQLGRFIEVFAAAVGILRGGMWLNRETKERSIRTAVILTIALVSELARDKELLTAIAEGEVDPKFKKLVSAAVNALLVLMVGSFLAVYGSGRHLSSALRSVFSSEQGDLQRILLCMWFAEVKGSGLTEMVQELLSGLRGLHAVNIALLWLYMRFVSGMTLGTTQARDLEAMLRSAVEEYIRRTAPRRRDARLLKDQVEQVLQDARRDRRIRRADSE